MQLKMRLNTRETNGAIKSCSTMSPQGTRFLFRLTSAILAGNRKISATMAGKLGKFFTISPAVFVPG
ncbi:MAG: hypothetical protein EXR28_09400 [Betaproteobacteria bacterium]|nr:hypothetical protein [Betaproteobacteria bacterium]